MRIARLLADAYLELRPTLVRFLAARTGSWAAAEDLAQDLYLRAARHDETGAEIDDAKAWLFRAGLNLAIDQRRSATRAAARDHASLLGRTPGEPAAEEPSAERAVDGRLRLQRLLALVDAMPPRMGEAFRLHKVEQLSQVDVAHRMGVSVKAVEKHLAAALQRIVEALPEQRR